MFEKSNPYNTDQSDPIKGLLNDPQASHKKCFEETSKFEPETRDTYLEKY